MTAIDVANEQADQKSYHQDLWLPDERLRLRAHGGCPGAARLCAGPTAADDADMIILNTCHIREKAAEKVFSDLGRLRVLKSDKAKARRPAWSSAVAGCVAQAEGEEILRARAVRRYRARAADLSSPAGDDGAKLARGGGPVLDTEFPGRAEIRSTCRRAPRRKRSRPSSRCRKAATNSAPSASCPIRAAPNISRPAAAVIAEARRLVASGAREITLLGQNVNAYHGAGVRWRSVGPRPADPRARRAPGLERLRYTTSHPRDMDDELIAAHRDVPKADAVPASAGAIGLGPHARRR